MSSCSAAPSVEFKDSNQQNKNHGVENSSDNCKGTQENEDEGENEHKDDVSNGNYNGAEYEEDDEEEDVDFIPFQREVICPEASSSLSSEVEGLDADVADSGDNVSEVLKGYDRANPQDCLVGDTEHGEEIVMQTEASSGKLMEKEIVSVTQTENETLNIKKNVSNRGTDSIQELAPKESTNGANSKMPILDEDDEDAICRRTRARYSLVGFTLDELETFLQETDDEDDIQNADDEEEYRKFLAAVLQGVDGSSTNAQENENVDDEDEDNDADFELEIEEALESDLDENMKDDIVEEYDAVDQRPKTRLSRRQKSSVEHKKKVSGESSRPLRPLLPYAPIASYSTLAGKGLIPRPATLCLRPVNDGFINGFTPYQIGQLHCLIHEHVQLLIQIFSICVLDPAKRVIASDIQKLISEMLCKRDAVLAQGRVPYPQLCFFPQHIHPSVAAEAPDVLPGRSTHGLSSASDMQKDCSSVTNLVQPSNRTSPSTGQLGYASSEQEGCLRTPEGSSWMPFIGDPTLSVLDVAPLKLARKFMDDVLSVSQEYQRLPLGATNDVRSEKVSLFPACNIQLSAETDCHASSSSSVDFTSSSNVQIAKKTLAASLVERAQKESIALVPKEIAKLAQQFYPLFNPALYPHKAPPAAVVNRVLFTDAEDKLLALGLMEHNTDWKAIQQRFLPCKSKHQIFVRQKNRSSAKAPENPIKAVRRMKNSPLTAEEIARIEEGLRVFKLDWMSVWKFIVPYRDPSLLPRQWRIAIGTQKSYKSDANKKERRRLYESQRRKSKAEKMDNGVVRNVEDKNSADDCTDKDDEAYVHEAFLADSRAGVSVISSKNPVPDLADESRPYPPEMGSPDVVERINESGCRDPLPQINQFPISLKSSNTEVFMRPYRARKSSTARVVKLAPELPPVNLPPTARVMSQSAFKTYQDVVYTKVSGADACQDVNASTDNGDLQVASAANTGVNYLRRDVEVGSNTAESNTSNQHHEESELLRDRQVVEEKDSPDLQMHPLLFRAPEDGHLLYYPLNSGPSAYSSFNFFPGSPPQLNLSLYRQTNRGLNFFNKVLKPKGKASTSSGLGFHPLLQRAADANCVSETANPSAQPSTYSELPRERFSQPPSSLGASRTESRMNNSLVAAHSPIGNYCEPDLEMHLSLTSRKQKALERTVTDDNVSRSSTSISDTQVNQSTSTLNRMSSNLGSSAQALAIPNEKDIVNNVDDISGQSLPGIVMEQEELSDSEEEEENVEFECEEMADSEGEISQSEQITSGQIEETDRVGSDEDSDDHIPVTRGISKDNSCNPSQGNITQLVLTDRERYRQPNSLCLNLNSFPPASPQSKLKDTTSGSVGKMQKLAGSKRSGVNVILDENRAKMEKPVANILEEMNLGTFASPLKKPRKRARRPYSISNVGGSKKGMPSLNRIESSKKANEGEID